MSPAGVQATSATEESDDVVITVDRLSKSYGSLPAVRELNLSISRAEVFGLIGPDGAGKTTTFHILGGVMEPTTGTVLVTGKTPRDARLNIGYLTQQFSLYLDLSVEENLRYQAGIKRIPEARYQERRNRYLHLMSLHQFSNRLAGQLSGGMKQKLALCCALIAQPEILLLDEPTTGVDPVSRREFWDVLTSVAHEGVTILAATPYLDEAERCDRIALMHNGTIQQTGTPRELKQKLNLKRLELRTPDLHHLVPVLSQAEGRPDLDISDVQSFGDRLDVLVSDSSTGESQIRALATGANISTLHIDVEEPTLENVFVLSLAHQSKGPQAPPFSFSITRERSSRKSTAISADKLSRTFGDFQAVKEISLAIGYGEIYGLLGANGAGKTTTIKMLCGLLDATTGEISLGGATTNLRNPEIRQRVGYMSQKFTLYRDLTVLENLEFYCGVYQVPTSLRSERIKWALSTCELTGHEKLITGNLPGGWKQRLSFGASVMHEPEILFLDEPTSGVDPIARRELWSMIDAFAKNGTAVLVTTHFLEEAEHCNRLGLMAAGRLVAQGTPSEIKGSQPGHPIIVIPSDPQKACEILRSNLESWRTTRFAEKIQVVLDNPDRDLAKVLSLLTENGIRVEGYKSGSYSLEDAFVSVVQRARGATL